MAKIISILIFFISANVYCQDSENLRFNQIDSLIASIPEKPNGNNQYKQIQSSGLIYKKTFIFFKKSVGSFHENILYKDKSIRSIRINKNLRNKNSMEYFYYDRVQLIKYVKKTESPKNNSSISFYWENGKIIGGTDYNPKNLDAILRKSIEYRTRWSELINQSGYKNAPQ